MLFQKSRQKLGLISKVLCDPIKNDLIENIIIQSLLAAVTIDIECLLAESCNNSKILFVLK